MWDVFCPCAAQDVLQTTYVICLKFANMSPVHGPCFTTIEEGGNKHSNFGGDGGGDGEVSVEEGTSR